MNATHALVLVTSDGDRRYLRTLGVGMELEMLQEAHSIEADLDDNYLLIVSPIDPSLREWEIAPTIEGVTLNGEPVARK